MRSMVVLYRLYSTVRRHSTYIVFNQVVTTASIALVAGQAFSDLLMDGCPGPREIGARRPRSPQSHLLLTMETAVTSRRSQAFESCEKIRRTTVGHGAPLRTVETIQSPRASSRSSPLARNPRNLDTLVLLPRRQHVLQAMTRSLWNVGARPA